MSNLPIKDSNHEFEEKVVDKMMDMLEHVNRSLTPQENSWSKDSTQVLPVLSTLPMICETDDCPYAPVCPVLRALANKEEEKKALYGQPCRVDFEEARLYFGMFVRSLEIKPDDAFDVLTVANLVRLHILRRRCDWELSVFGMSSDVIQSIHQASGKPYYKRSANEILREASEIDKKILLINSQLVASRKDKAQAAAQLVKNKGILDLLRGTRAVEQARKMALGKDEDVIELDMTEDTDEIPE